MNNSEIKNIIASPEQKKAYHNYYFMKNCRAGNLEKVKQYLLEIYNNPITEIDFLPNEETELNIDGNVRLGLSIKIENRFIEHYNKALIWSCSDGYLDIVKYLLTNKDFPEPADIFFAEARALSLAIQKKHLNIVKFILTSPQLKYKIDIDYSNELFTSVCYSNLEMLEYLACSKELRKNLDLEKLKIEGFKNACDKNKTDLIDFFVNHPNPKYKVNVHTNNDIGFILAYKNNNIDTINYLIFGCGLKKSKYINRQLHLKKKKNEKFNVEIEDLFEKGLIYNKIQQQIENKPIKVVRKRKI